MNIWLTIKDLEPFGCSKKEEYYKLTDSFCNFYLRFVENKKELSNGLKYNEYSGDFTNVIDMDALFD